MTQAFVNNGKSAEEAVEMAGLHCGVPKEVAVRQAPGSPEQRQFTPDRDRARQLLCKQAAVKHLHWRRRTAPLQRTNSAPQLSSPEKGDDDPDEHTRGHYDGLVMTDASQAGGPQQAASVGTGGGSGAAMGSAGPAATAAMVQPDHPCHWQNLPARQRAAAAATAGAQLYFVVISVRKFSVAICVSSNAWACNAGPLPQAPVGSGRFAFPATDTGAGRSSQATAYVDRDALGSGTQLAQDQGRLLGELLDGGL